MRLASLIAVALMVVVAPACADDRCAGRAQAACEMVSFYKAMADKQLPKVITEQNVKLRLISATAEGPQLIIRCRTAKSAKGLARILSANGQSMSELQTYFTNETQTGVCESVGGPAFLAAGAVLVVELTTSDRQPLLNTTIQSCAGA